MSEKKVIDLLDFVKVDRLNVSCHFTCPVKGKTVISTVPFEPYEGKIELSLKDIVFHPIQSWNKYFHTPITIYNSNCHDTIVKKAFKKVAEQFAWDEKTQNYIYI